MFTKSTSDITLIGRLVNHIMNITKKNKVRNILMFFFDVVQFLSKYQIA